MPAADRRGIAITNSSGTLFETTADLTFGLIIAARRRMFEAERYLRDGRWVQDDLDLLLGHDVYGATLGIVGYGEIGRAVARRAHGFGMTVIHHRRTPRDDELSRWVELDELLRTSDIVSLHVPVVAGHAPPHRRARAAADAAARPRSSTRRAARSSTRPPSSGRCARAGSARPGSTSRRSSRTRIRPTRCSGWPNCVVMPHIGSATLAARVRMIGLATDNVVAHLEGRPLLTPVGAVGARR